MTTTAPRGRDGVVSVRRIVNDHIAEVAERLDDHQADLFDFMCECGELRCPEFVPLTVDEYRKKIPGSVRAH